MVSYKEGIIKAIDDLKDRTGSSLPAIKKHMQASHPQDKKWANGMFLSVLKSMVASGDIVQTKGSYKLSANFKKKRTDASKPKKPKKKAEAPPKKKATPKKAATKKDEEAPKKKVKDTTAPKKVRFYFKCCPHPITFSS
jgi:histone H1/5